MLFLRYKNELTLTQKKAPQRLDFCGASLMPNKNSFYPKLSPLLHSFLVSRSRFNQAQCKTTATRFLHGHFGLAGYDTLLYLIRSRVLLVISIFTVGIESGYVLLARFKEVERKVGCTCILVCNTSNKPVAGSFCLTGHGNVITRFCFNVLAVVLVYCHILDELESIHVLFVVLNQVGSHLQRAV